MRPLCNANALNDNKLSLQSERQMCAINNGGQEGDRHTVPVYLMFLLLHTSKCTTLANAVALFLFWRPIYTRMKYQLEARLSVGYYTVCRSPSYGDIGKTTTTIYYYLPVNHNYYDLRYFSLLSCGGCIYLSGELRSCIYCDIELV